MSAEWHYLANQKQSGPVELSALKQLLATGGLSSKDLVFGPGLTEWTPAGRVAELFSDGDASPIPVASIATDIGPTSAGMLAYRGAETGAAGISRVATGLFRDTKPWARAVAIVMFIGSALFILIGTMGAIFLGFNSGSVIPVVGGLFYVALGALSLLPAIFLNRYATAIGVLLRTNRMSDLELAIRSQKSYWKFMGMMMLVVVCIGAVFVVIIIMGRM